MIINFELFADQKLFLSAIQSYYLPKADPHDTFPTVANDEDYYELVADK